MTPIDDRTRTTKAATATAANAVSADCSACVVAPAAAMSSAAEAGQLHRQLQQRQWKQSRRQQRRRWPSPAGLLCLIVALLALLVATEWIQQPVTAAAAPATKTPGKAKTTKQPQREEHSGGSGSYFASPPESEAPWTSARRAAVRSKVRGMFLEAFEGYMAHAFPHDELKPLSQTWTDSMAELGNAPDTVGPIQAAAREAAAKAKEKAAAAAAAAKEKGTDSEAAAATSSSGGAGATPQIDSSKPYRGMALTLLDSLSTLAVLEDAPRFCAGVDWLSRHLTFDVDLRVHLFELNIRVLGGLLSAHLLATDPERKRSLTENVDFVPLDAVAEANVDGTEGDKKLVRFQYRGELLTLATDLGERMLRAFRTPTASESALPYAFVHLQAGVLAGESEETCAAGAGTLVLEFGMLTALTGDERFLRAADGALHALWGLRHARTGLFPSTFTRRGRVLDAVTGVGSSVDSLYEYLFKGALLLDRKRYMDMALQAIESAELHLRATVLLTDANNNATEGLYAWHNRRPGMRSLDAVPPASTEWCEANLARDWMMEVDFASGTHVHYSFNSLQAFWPALLVLAGRVDDARHLFASFFSLWTRYSALPERWNFLSHTLHSTEQAYPLRPELAESAYALFRATKDSLYLDAAERIVHDLDKHARVRGGGFAGIASVDPSKATSDAGGASRRPLIDRQESFFLAETLKYLYLIFADEDHWMHRGHGAPSVHSADPDAPRSVDYILSTEGHIFPLRAELMARTSDDAVVYGSLGASPSSFSSSSSDAPRMSAEDDEDALRAWDAKRRFDVRVRQVGRDMALKELSLAPADNKAAKLLRDVLAAGTMLESPGGKGAVHPHSLLGQPSSGSTKTAPHKWAHMFRFREGYFHPALVSRGSDPAEYSKPEVNYFHTRWLGEETARGGRPDAALPPAPASPAGSVPFTGDYERASMVTPTSVRDYLHGFALEPEEAGYGVSTLSRLQCPLHGHHLPNIGPRRNFLAYDYDYLRWHLKRNSALERSRKHERWLARAKAADAAVAAADATTTKTKANTNAAAAGAAAAKGSEKMTEVQRKAAITAAMAQMGKVISQHKQLAEGHSSSPSPHQLQQLLQERLQRAGVAIDAHVEIDGQRVQITPELFQRLLENEDPRLAESLKIELDRSQLPASSASSSSSPPKKPAAEGDDDDDDDRVASREGASPAVRMGSFTVRSAPGLFVIRHTPTRAGLTLRNLASEQVEILHQWPEPFLPAAPSSSASGGGGGGGGPAALTNRGRRPPRQVFLTLTGEEAYLHSLEVRLDLPDGSDLCSGSVFAAPGHFGPSLPPAPPLNERGSRARFRALSAAQLTSPSFDVGEAFRELGRARMGEEALLQAWVVSLDSLAAADATSENIGVASGCHPLSQSLVRQVKGHIVVVMRGECTFMQKARMLQSAGALGMLVWNRSPVGSDQALFSMGSEDPTGRAVDDITIPAFMISNTGGEWISQCLSRSGHNRRQAATQSKQQQTTTAGMALDATPLPRLPLSIRRQMHEPGSRVAVPLSPVPLSWLSTGGAAAATHAQQQQQQPPAFVQVDLSPNADHFTVRTLGGWQAHVDWNEQQQNFQLKLEV